MKSLKFLLGAGAVAIAAALAPTTAGATTSGSLYFVSEAESQSATIGFAHGAPVATFTVPSGAIDFDSRNAANGYTVSGFLLTNPGTVILTDTSPSAALDDGTHGVMIELTGQVTVTNGQTFTVTHDDGLQLQIGGLLVVNVPGPTSPNTTTVTYTGPSGTFAFDLVYGECCGAPAVLATNLPLNVPEPASLAIFGTALLGFGALRRRRNRA